eukprot:TRINITY_DN6229_c0_g1_i1.p1 TRINITY_DN6229_c0_g1~~TRINITY_DN6229_c0_g1_i1.p1  ORF type:complete len:781 (-),score=153.69 TRINITY_DN6229_c0_g1_i1:97-2439(-)
MYSLYFTAGLIVLATVLWKVQGGALPRRRVFRNLLDAALEGNFEDIAKLISADEKYPVDLLRDKEANTPLSIVARRGLTSAVKLLLQWKASVTSQNVHRFTPLHMAVFHAESVDCALALLDAGANIEAPDQNGWTALHIAASKGNDAIVDLLLSKGASINATTIANQTPLLMAACNGHIAVVRRLISANADTKIRVASSHESALIYAVQNGHNTIAKELITYDAELLTLATVSGATPLHVAVQVDRKDMVELLLDAGANVNAKKGDGDSPLHIACLLNRVGLISYLIERGANLSAKNNYGATVLHSACSRKRLETVLELLRCGASVSIRDNDGLTPFHTLCSSFVTIEDQDNSDPSKTVEIQIANALIKAGAEINSPDRVGGTPLHHCVCKKEHAHLLKFLLEKGADPSIEDKTGWTPIQLEAQMYPNKFMHELLLENLKTHHAEYFATLDLKKPRAEKEHVDPAAALLSAEERFAVLGGQVSLEAVAKRIAEGKSKNIIILTGAGISTSAGIPDFRSPDKGLYTNKNLLRKFNISSGQQIFSMGDFMHDPELFYAVAKEYFLPVVRGAFKPTLCHRFIALLHKKGLLTRNYTQNIDMLERHAGVPDDLIVESHGSFARATCQECHAKVSDMDEFWRTVENDQIPICERCKGSKIKPDIVFFGEGLPARFNDLQQADFAKCDLVIVMGTSLQVYPFAGLVTKAAATVPRLMINGDLVGPFRGIDHWKIEGPGKDPEFVKLTPDLPNREIQPYRDVAVVSDIDVGIAKLAQYLGWEAELNI